jgi:hypothetical protein
VRTDNRLFAPFPIEMDEHPKIFPLSDAAFRALFEATFYSRRMLSDGFLDERVVLKRWGQAVADELCSNDPERPSWVRVDGGYRIHDFDKHHPLRADVEAKTEAKRNAGKLGGEASGKSRRSKAEADAKQTGTKTNPETETETETETTRARAVQVPKDFKITDAMREWAAKETPLVDVDAKLSAWRDYWVGVGKAQKDWAAVWRNGMRKQQEFAERDRKPQTQKPMSVDELKKRRARLESQT